MGELISVQKDLKYKLETLRDAGLATSLGGVIEKAVEQMTQDPISCANLAFCDLKLKLMLAKNGHNVEQMHILVELMRCLMVNYLRAPEHYELVEASLKAGLAVAAKPTKKEKETKDKKEVKG